MNSDHRFSYRLAPRSERPRERCLRQGGQALTLQELLAILLSPGVRGRGCWEVSHALLREDFWNIVRSGAVAEWLERNRVPPSGRARILAAVELAQRFSAQERVRWAAQQEIKDVGYPAIAMQALAEVPDERRTAAVEWLGFVAIDGLGSVGPLQILAEGDARSVSTDVRAIALRLLLLDARAIVLLHNHPSGQMEASDDDRELTRQVAEIGMRLGAPLMGHWIVGPRGELWLGAQNIL